MVKHTQTDHFVWLGFKGLSHLRELNSNQTKLKFTKRALNTESQLLLASLMTSALMLAWILNALKMIYTCSKFRAYCTALYITFACYYVQDHPFSMCAKFSGNLTFLALWFFAQVLMRIREYQGGKKCYFFGKCWLCTKLVIPMTIFYS